MKPVKGHTGFSEASRISNSQTKPKEGPVGFSEASRRSNETPQRSNETSRMSK